MCDGDETRESETPCPYCKAETTLVQDCWNCFGKGQFDDDELLEEDPFWYEEGDTEPCDICHGSGISHWCQACGYDLIQKTMPLTKG